MPEVCQCVNLAITSKPDEQCILGFSRPIFQVDRPSLTLFEVVLKGYTVDTIDMHAVGEKILRFAYDNLFVLIISDLCDLF